MGSVDLANVIQFQCIEDASSQLYSVESPEANFGEVEKWAESSYLQKT